MRLYPHGIWLYERLHSTYLFPDFESSIDEGVYGAIGYNVHVIINDTCIMWLSSLVFRQDRAHKASPSLHLSRTLRIVRRMHTEIVLRTEDRLMSADTLWQLRECHTNSYTI